MASNRLVGMMAALVLAMGMFSTFTWSQAGRAREAKAAPQAQVAGTQFVLLTEAGSGNPVLVEFSKVRWATREEAERRTVLVFEGTPSPFIYVRERPEELLP